MAKFIVDKPVVTAASSVAVDELPVGRHRFQLEVVTDTDQRSQPDEAVVLVQASFDPVLPVRPPLSPIGPLSPVVPLRTIVSPTAPPSAVSLASTLPKTVSPSATSSEAPPATAAKNTVPPISTRRATSRRRPRKK